MILVIFYDFPVAGNIEKYIYIYTNYNEKRKKIL